MLIKDERGREWATIYNYNYFGYVVSEPTGPDWRLRRIKIAAVSSKSQKLQQQHQFSTRQRIFRHQSGK